MKIGKKLLSLFLCIIFLCSGLAVNSSAADEFTYGDYSYTVSSDEVTIVSYPEQATGTVNIPSKIDGKEVVAIDDGAFQACTLITEVIIPNTVTTIGKYAFAYCVTLNSVTIPSNVTSIGQDAFQNSKNVTIKCESGSYAEKYAKNEKINFIFIGNIYNLGEETYGFDNYSDEDNAGHCFGMSITSSGYYNKQLSTSIVGLDSCKEVNSLFRTKMVTKPICFYQKRQGKSSTKAIVAGGSSYLGLSVNLKKDWNEVVEYVKNHSFDDKGSLQIGYRGKTWNSKGEIVSAGHAINFLRYENVSGQDRIYAYDNNFPDYETFFYMDSKDVLHQEPSQTFSIEIESICLRDIF